MVDIRQEQDVTPIGDTVTQIDTGRERLITIYRKKAKHYDITCRLYPERPNAAGPFKRSAFARVTP